MGTSRLPEFQERFKELRGEMTQGQFAEKLGISRPTVGLYESGARIPDAEVLRDIAEKCNVSADYLLGLTDLQSIDPDYRAACKYTGLTEQAVYCLHKLPDVGVAFSEIICEDGLSVSQALNMLGDAVSFAQNQHETMKKEVGSNPDKIIDYFPKYKSLIENIELALFRFERECRRLPDEIYEASDLINELNSFVWEELNADDEQD